MNRKQRRAAERGRDAYDAACEADTRAYEAWRAVYERTNATQHERDEAWNAYEVTQRARSAAFIAWCDAFPALRETATRSGLYVA